MSVARVLLVIVSLLVSVPRVSAQVTCDDLTELCTDLSDPCTMPSLSVDSGCTVDFGSRGLVIQGVITVPIGGVLSLTATTVRLNGRIEARHTGASITLIAGTGDADIRGEIDVAGVTPGSITVQAAGNIDVKNRLTSKALDKLSGTGGAVTLDAGGTLTTNNAAVIDARGGANGPTIVLAGDAGVTIAGRVFADATVGGNVQLTSSAGTVTLDKDIRIKGSPAGTATVSGATGVVLNDGIKGGTNGVTGPSVNLDSSGGNVTIGGSAKYAGVDGGSLVVTAPLGLVTPRAKLYVKGKMNGGSISIAAADVDLVNDMDARGTHGDGGSVQITATNTLDASDVKAITSGALNGGAIGLLADPSGSVVGDGVALTAIGGATGGQVVVSAPAGSVTLSGRIDAGSKGTVGGSVQIDGDDVNLIPKFRVDADCRTAGGEVRINQTGTGELLMTGTYDAHDGGVIEALAPAGSLTVVGKLLVGSGGCIGLADADTPDISAATADQTISMSCP